MPEVQLSSRAEWLVFFLPSVCERQPRSRGIVAGLRHGHPRSNHLAPPHPCRYSLPRPRAENTPLQAHRKTPLSGKRPGGCPTLNPLERFCVAHLFLRFLQKRWGWFSLASCSYLVGCPFCPFSTEESTWRAELHSSQFRVSIFQFRCPAYGFAHGGTTPLIRA